MKKVFVAVSIVVLMLSLKAIAGNNNIGINTNYTYNYYNPDIYLDLITFNKKVENSGRSLGIIYKNKLSNLIKLSFSFNYDYSDLHSHIEEYLSYSHMVLGVIDLNSKLNFFDFSLACELHNLIPIKGTYIMAGVGYGIIEKKDYSLNGYYYSTTSPTSVYNGFIDHKGELPNLSNKIFLLAGVGYELNISNHIILNPIFTYKYNVKSISSEKLYINQIMLGINFLYEF